MPGTSKRKLMSHPIAAALRYFGLLEYQVSNGIRSIVISNLGRNYLRAQQERVRQDIIQSVAMEAEANRDLLEWWHEFRPLMRFALTSWF